MVESSTVLWGWLLGTLLAMLEKKGHKDHNCTTPDPPPKLTCTQALGPHVASADLFPTKASPVPGLTGEPLTRSYSATRNGKCVPIGKAFCAARVSWKDSMTFVMSLVSDKSCRLSSWPPGENSP